MNKKIISVLMTAAMLASAVPAMATTEGIVQDDILLISANPTTENTFAGVVSAIDGQLVTITIDGADYTFGLAEDVELGDIAVGDAVSVTSTSSLMTKDIKPATSISKTETAHTDELVTVSYNRYEATVGAVGEGTVDAAIGDMVVTFATTDNTAIYTIDGEKADTVKEGDKVIILSTSTLMTKDIKEAAAIVITNDEANASVYLDTFKMTEEGLLSADGELIVAMEGAEEYDGKKLLVFYDFATMSIPAITNPIKVVELEAEDSHKVSVSFKVGDSTLTINGEAVTVETPYVVGTGVTLVPIRVISEAFGAEVNWDGETKTVTVSCGECKVIVTVGSKTALVNGEEKTLEEAPELTDGGFSMIPLRFISESLGATVGYDNETAQITVVK